MKTIKTVQQFSRYYNEIISTMILEHEVDDSSFTDVATLTGNAARSTAIENLVKNTDWDAYEKSYYKLVKENNVTVDQLNSVLKAISVVQSDDPSTYEIRLELAVRRTIARLLDEEKQD